MLVPATYAAEAANKAHAKACLSNPDKFKTLYSGDSVSFDQFNNANTSTWHGYDFVSVNNDNEVIGMLDFNANRPTKIIKTVSIALYNDKFRKTFYKDLMTVLNMIYDASHPAMYFKTVQPSQAYDIYETLCKKGCLMKYDVPFDFTIIRGKEYKWHHYAMSHNDLGKFLNKFIYNIV